MKTKWSNVCKAVETVPDIKYYAYYCCGSGSFEAVDSIFSTGDTYPWSTSMLIAMEGYWMSVSFPPTSIHMLKC